MTMDLIEKFLTKAWTFKILIELETNLRITYKDIDHIGSLLLFYLL